MLFSNLTVPRKLLVSSLIFTIPLAVMAVFIVSGILYDQEFTAKEAYGTEYLAPLVRLLVELPAYGRAEAVGDGTAQGLGASIDASFAILGEEQARYGEILAVTPAALALRDRSRLEPRDLEGRWATAKRAGGGRAAEASEALAADVRELIVHVGDASNLILDPDLDTYYLMDVCLLAIPDSIVRLNAERGKVGTDGMADPVFRALNAEVDRMRITGSSRTALMEDPNFLGRDELLQEQLPPSLADYASASIALDRTRFGDYGAVLDKALSATLAYWDIAADNLSRLLLHRVASHRRRLILAVVAASLSTLFAYVVVFAISRNLLSQIAGIRKAVSVLATKDLRLPKLPASKDELGATADDMATLAEELNVSLQSIHSAVLTLESSSEDMSSSSEELRQSSGDLASSVEQISAAMEESNSTMASIRNNVDRQFEAIDRAAGSLEESSRGLEAMAGSMSSLRSLATEGGKAAENGRVSIQKLIDEARRLGDRARILVDRIKDISEAAVSIGAVVDVIADIAEQTQLLAMNASIEAAHAGSAGKGFAVVAGAVRNLSDETSRALGTIRGRIAAIGGTVEEASSASAELKSLSDDVSGRTGTAESALVRIGESSSVLEREIGLLFENLGVYERLMAGTMGEARSLKDFSEAIRTAVGEQDSGSQEIMRAVVALRGTATSNADYSASLARISTTLRSGSRALDSIVGEFSLEEAGPGAGRD